jgi:hypothetical protein
VSKLSFLLIFLPVCLILDISVQASKPTSLFIGNEAVGSKGRATQHEAARQRSKVVDQGVAYANQPVEIIDLKINGKTAELNVGNDADTEWLNGLSWKIKNTSKKNIVTIDLFVCFPDAKLDGRMLVYPMHYGIDPKIPGSTGTITLLKPNESADFVITDDNYKSLKPYLEQRAKLTDVNHVRIKLELIVFDDDTAWSTGQEMRRDPNNPRAFSPIE